MATALLVFEAGRDPAPAVAWLREVMPGLDHLHVLVWAPPATGFWTEARWLQAQTRLDEGEAALSALEAVLGEAGPRLSGEVVTELDAPTLQAAADRVAARLVAWGPVGDRADGMVRRLLEPTSRHSLPMLMIGAGAGPARPVRHVLSPWRGDPRQLLELPALLRAVGADTAHLTLLDLPPHDPSDDPRPTLLAAGLDAVEVSRIEGGLLDLPAAARTWLAEHPTDLIAVALPTSAVAAVLLPWLVRAAPDALPAPLLVAPARGQAPGALHCTDLLLDAEGRGRLRIEATDRFGSPQPWSGTLVLRHAGQELGEVEVVAGAGITPPLPAGARAVSLREGGQVRVSAVRCCPLDAGVMDIIDASLGPDALAAAAPALARDPKRQVLAVRVSPDQGIDSLRRGLAHAGLAHAVVVDAAVLLDDGGGEDLPARVDSLRLVRLARHLRVAGARVDRLALRRTEALAAPGLALWQPGAQPAPARRTHLQARPAHSLEARLDALTGSRRLPGCPGRVYLSSREARTAWLAAIAGARERVHMQTYIVEDDAMAERVLAALAAAASRGVTVRVLVDSLLSRWSSLGARNPLLLRLAEAPGVTVREYRPLAGVPDLDDLKQRDHRKLLIVDDDRAIVTGRNLGAQYLTDLEEVLVTPSTPSGRIPWLDAGVELAGPVVREVQGSFLSAWHQSGGATFPVRTAPPVEGAGSARLVVHEGLRDTHTLDAYRALFDNARQRLWIVNTFPLQQELLRAALRALHRGIDVRVLVGNVRPVHGDRVPFPAGPSLGADLARSLATQVIHGRLDQLAEAGARVGEVARRDLPGWDPARGLVRPHVHAKLVVVDGRVVATGSANLDVTAGYWESEALAILSDPDTAAAVETVLERLASDAVPFDPDDPTWRVRAERRAWLSASWPSLVG